MPIPVYPSAYVDKSGETKYLPAPSRPLTEGVKTNNLVTSFESGHEQRRVKGDPRRTFEWTYNVLSEQEASLLVTFFIQRYGNVQSFIWTHPMSKEQLQVRFDMDAMVKENFAHGPKGPLYKLNVKLVQVF